MLGLVRSWQLTPYISTAFRFLWESLCGINSFFISNLLVLYLTKILTFTHFFYYRYPTSVKMHPLGPKPSTIITRFQITIKSTSANQHIYGWHMIKGIVYLSVESLMEYRRYWEKKGQSKLCDKVLHRLGCISRTGTRYSTNIQQKHICFR